MASTQGFRQKLKIQKSNMKILFKQTEMYQTGPTVKTGFVIHGTLGSYEGSIEWLTKKRSQNPSSAHAVIAKDGRITQICKISDIAWHAGRVSNPSKLALETLKKGMLGNFINPNEYTVGIEFEWYPGENLTQEQINTFIEFVEYLENLKVIKNPFFLGHKDIASYKSDDMEFACKIFREYFSNRNTDTKKQTIDKLCAILKEAEELIKKL